MSDTFVTIFRNRSDGSVLIEDYNGKIAMLEPGENYEIKSISARTLFSRFSEVVYKRRGVIDLKENRDWRNPYESFWCIELANLEGAPNESIQLLPPREAGEVVGLSPHNYVVAFRGFPRIVPVAINCRLIKYSRIEWRMVTEKVPMEGAPGYWEMRTELKMLRFDRPPIEIKKINKELEKIALEKAKAEAIRSEDEQAK